jgi:hypothetical protein
VVEVAEVPPMLWDLVVPEVVETVQKVLIMEKMEQLILEEEVVVLGV